MCRVGLNSSALVSDNQSLLLSDSERASMQAIGNELFTIVMATLLVAAFFAAVKLYRSLTRSHERTQR